VHDTQRSETDELETLSPETETKILVKISATIDLFSLRKTSSVAMVDCLVVELNDEEI